MSDEPKKSPTLLSVLSESTMLPVSFVALICGIVFWASNIAARSDANGLRIDKLEAKQAAILELQEQMTAVETKLDIIYDRIRMHEAAGMIVAPKRPLKSPARP